MQQDTHLEFLQACCYCLDGIPGVSVYVPVPVPTLPLQAVSTAQLCLNALCSTSVDLFHISGNDVIKNVSPCHTYNVIDIIYSGSKNCSNVCSFVNDCIGIGC